jgi:hypothetical protein
VILSWLRRRRRRRLLATPFPAAWRSWLDTVPLVRVLEGKERVRLQDILRVLVAEKHWEGCDGLTVTEEMKVVIASQAALLLLEIEHDFYARLLSILVYPTAYGTPFERRARGGVVSLGDRFAGQAWYQGPVILSWEHVRRGTAQPGDGQNVVLHEFAHRLDFGDTWVNGTPPLASRAQADAWAEVMTREYRALREAAAEDRATVLDPYGATNEAEFFAVATEAFFMKPRALERGHPELYDLLRSYYGQDPAGRPPLVPEWRR